MNNDLAQFFGGVAFTPGTVEPQGDFPVISPGKYRVLTGVAEVRQTKKGTGHYIYLPVTILDDPYKNRKLWDQINIDNPSAECVEIGLRTLSALGRALDIQAITETSQISNQVVIAHVKVKNDQNYIRTYSASTQPSSGTISTATPDATPGSAPQQSTTAQKPPWMK